jgi:NADH-quinone oxidoreductase subunit L
MMMGVGVYAAASGVFHLFTHAFFKALLFLGAGSVMHAMGGVIDVRHFSGLKKVLPWTFLTFLIGSLALAGFPFLSGFFSKDEIIHHALSVHPILGVMGLITAALTAFYTFRMVFLAFYGPEKVPEGVHPHESGPWMLVPLFILAAGAVLAGYVGIEAVEHSGAGFHSFLAPVFHDTFEKAAGHAAEGAHAGTEGGFLAQYGLMVLSGGISILAIGLAYVFYVRMPWVPALVRATATGAHRTLWKKYYVDEAYNAAFVQPSWFAGKVAVGLDDYLIDGLLWVITAVPKAFGYLMRTAQSGLLQGYGLTMVAGAAVIVLLVLAL